MLLRFIANRIYSKFEIEGINRLLLFAGLPYTELLLQRYGAKIGKNVRIHSPLIIQNADKDYSNLIIGDNCHIGKDVLLDLKSPIIIEDNVTISMRVTITTHFNVGDSPLSTQIYPCEQGKVWIKRGSYLGAGAIVLLGVTIGECTTIGAGAVVIKDIPPCSVAVGIPARVVKQRKNKQIDCS